MLCSRLVFFKSTDHIQLLIQTQNHFEFTVATNSLMYVYYSELRESVYFFLKLEKNKKK
jgi:hypothetical protein